MATTEVPVAAAPAVAANVEPLVARMQALIARIEAIPDPAQREFVNELLGSVMDLYGAGLERIGRALAEAGEPGEAIKRGLVEDGVVASLLLIHDLYPIDLVTRVRRALDQVRPYMESHGGDIELLGLDGGVARLRLVGSCRTCRASSLTLETAVRQALEEHAPDLAGMEVEGAEPPPTARLGFVPLEGLAGDDGADGPRGPR